MVGLSIGWKIRYIIDVVHIEIGRIACADHISEFRTEIEESVDMLASEKNVGEKRYLYIVELSFK